MTYELLPPKVSATTMQHVCKRAGTRRKKCASRMPMQLRPIGAAVLRVLWLRHDAAAARDVKTPDRRTYVCVHKFTQHVQQRSCTNSQHKTTRAAERRLEHCLLFSTGLTVHKPPSRRLASREIIRDVNREVIRGSRQRLSGGTHQQRERARIHAAGRAAHRTASSAEAAPRWASSEDAPC